MLKKYGPSLATLVLVVITGILLSIPKPHILYPDSYIYAVIARSQDFFIKSISYNGAVIPFDYFVSIKPLAPFITSLLLWAGSYTTFINILFLVAGITALIVSFRQRKHTHTTQILAFLLVLSSGAIIYWISRASTEYFSFMLLSFLLSALRMRKFRIGIVIALLLGLIRPEMIFIFPLLLRIPVDTANKKQHMLWRNSLYALLLTFYIVMGLISNSGVYAILYVLLPFAVICLILAFITHAKKYQAQILQWTTALSQFGIPFMVLFSAIIVLIASLGYVSSSVTPVLGSILCGGLLLLVAYLSWQKRAIMSPYLILSALVLGGVYTYNSSDTFRYLIFVIPFLLAIVLSSEWENFIAEQVMQRLMIFAVVFQLVMVFVSLPLASLSIDYWQDRLNGQFEKDYTIWSSTPLMTAYRHYRSGHICDLTVELPLAQGYYVVDGYAQSLCPQKLESILPLLLQYQVSAYRSPVLVQIDRFQSVGDTTTVYWVR
ncbi:MAG: hypothetical protein QY314_04545 [Candidatus Dojkabacteria bacterium]|nr:MAG: hypothetical protein QY314_04545 [Candidatus Dojkabacteria bacterium]